MSDASREIMKIHHIGTVLLGCGFAMLVGVVLLLDPTAPDANIGAGILAMVGVPVGTLGLVLIIGHALFRTFKTVRS
ncbi:hypothetical protein [Microbacterium sp. ABRD28]|uniref:hypothetical protein n=1 Tax=Microbacterium sp. ABRD28 TaxID=2268461 RepID=UPI000F550E27|nr:hypothetical protein [Microbacterium sp. ABRD28]AZC13008.1 hypothetical protein DT073_04165 [Microbacterium sp. ABRD28]